MISLADAAAPLRRPAVLVEMLLPSATLRVCSHAGGLTWGGSSWTGLGHLGAVEPFTDGPEISGMRFTLAGVQPEQIQIALAEPVRWRRCHVYHAELEDADDTVHWCERVWSGHLDRMALTTGSQAGVIQVYAEHVGAILSRVKLTRYTDEDQRRLHGGDASLARMAVQASARIVWPDKTWRAS